MTNTRTAQDLRKWTGYVAILCTMLCLGVFLTKSFGTDTVDVRNGSVPAGGDGTFSVFFVEGNTPTVNAGIQLDIAYDSTNTPIAPDGAGNPDCQMNPASQKSGSFVFLPGGCSGTSCTHIRAIVLSLSGTGPIPADTELFNCRVTPPTGTAEGNYLLTVVGALGSDSSGNSQPVYVSGGFINVPSGGC